eukprot:scaffold49614_cov146-Isochrysis_galbana.AAC.1
MPPAPILGGTEEAGMINLCSKERAAQQTAYQGERGRGFSGPGHGPVGGARVHVDGVGMGQGQGQASPKKTAARARGTCVEGAWCGNEGGGGDR